MSDTTKRIVYVNTDGSIGVIAPSPNSKLTVEEIQAKDVPSGLASYIVEASDVPTDRSFRGAWTYTP